MVKHPARGGRVVGIRVGASGVCGVSSRHVSELEGPLARLGGSALAFALVAESESPRLVFTLGEATRRGLPSAGRVHIAGRSPLTGGFTEGAVGGSLAWALAGLLDGTSGAAGATPEPRDETTELLLRRANGEVDPGLAGLYLEFEGEPGPGPRVLELVATDAGAFEARLLPGLAPELGAGDLARFLVQETRLAAGWIAAAVAAGPGARRGVPFGILVTGDEVPVTTGRGGLGTLLVSLGLAALVVRAPERERVLGGELAMAARNSPRLLERSRGGTLELFGAYAARGDLRGRNYQVELAPEQGRALARAAAGAEVAHHGCKGCPTPCGLIFDRPRGKRGGARFGATFALGPNLGFEGESSFAAALDLLGACDAEGLDAREAGACLALLARHHELHGGHAHHSATPALPSFAFGDLDGMRAAIAQLPAMGSVELAALLGLEAESFAAGGQAARPEADLAALLGQVVATAGNDPMRSFPFLVARPGGSGPELPDGTPVDPGAFDPRVPTGKGRLVAWHEDLAAALDIAGFCSFSAAGLLVDEVLDLDKLAGWIAPAALGGERAGAGARFLAAGRELVLARRAFERRVRGALQIPEWARANLALPGMLDGYLAARGEGPAEVSLQEERGPVAATSDAAPASIAKGRVTIAAAGSLGDVLGTDGVVELELDLPARRDAVLRALVAAVPRAARKVFDDRERLMPGVWRAGQPVGPEDWIVAGERLDLVLVIGGG